MLSLEQKIAAVRMPGAARKALRYLEDHEESDFFYKGSALTAACRRFLAPRGFVRIILRPPRIAYQITAEGRAALHYRRHLQANNVIR